MVGTIYFHGQFQRLERVDAELTSQGQQIDRLSRELTEHIDAHAIEHAEQADAHEQEHTHTRRQMDTLFVQNFELAGLLQDLTNAIDGAQR